ncbi:MAG: NAD(P)/FAD-dependent oxidoreductase [Phycisphaerales bacterium]
MEQRADIAVVGAGAAGLFTAIWAGRTAQTAGAPLRVVALDSAARLGAKILVAGGGRCNVTHHAVTERDYAGSTPASIRKVLQRFPVERTRAFFAEFGVQLKQEETGKLFPTTDQARTVLDALLNAAHQAGAQLQHPARVESIQRSGDGFEVGGPWGRLHARTLVLCTGGKALPKSGSDGRGYAFATALGHTVAEPVVPALVPLVLEQGHWLTLLSGLALPAELTLWSGTEKRLATASGSLLCTHFGISGPAVLDISRHLLVARSADPGAHLTASWLPGQDMEAVDALLVRTKERSVLACVRTLLPERMARAVCQAAGLDPAATVQQTSRERRRQLARLLARAPLPVTADRGFTFAEATAGGVPLAEVRLDTMESRCCPGLYLAGEVLDVDGRIGGFNFQWAWASGHVAGCSAARALTQRAQSDSAG